MENVCDRTSLLDLASSWPGVIGLVVLCAAACFCFWVALR